MVSTVLTCSLALTACEPATNGLTTISVDANGALQVGLCQSMNVREIRVSVDARSGDELRSTEWKGYSVMSEGQTISFDGSGEFSLVDLAANSMMQDLYIYVYLYERPYGHGKTAWGVFSVDTGTLRTGEWLLPNGDSSDTVCGGYQRLRRS